MNLSVLAYRRSRQELHRDIRQGINSFACWDEVGLSPIDMLSPIT
jgi:hypothetical protein